MVMFSKDCAICMTGILASYFVFKWTKRHGQYTTLAARKSPIMFDGVNHRRHTKHGWKVVNDVREETTNVG